MAKIEKIYTENPYVDELVYYTKLLAYDTVLKNEKEANENETLTSLRNADLYIACVDGTAIDALFSSYTASAIIAGGAGALLEEALLDKTVIPNDAPEYLRTKVFEAMVDETIANYEEQNNYYRMLYGLPNLGSSGIYITSDIWSPPDDIIIDLTIPIHEMDQSAITILNNYEVIDDLLSDEDLYMSRRYLKHLGDKKISPYVARKAKRFDVLYVLEIDNESILRMYKDKLEISRAYVLKTVYSEAFAYGSDYYDAFISLFIVLITMVDLISRVQEFIARKEIFDIRSVKYIFESNGIAFFADIPLRYQISLIKNLHTLIKYKSTSKCMVDICSIFGFENVNIFKYYLLRDKTIDSSTGDFILTGDVTQDYELKFVKIPLDGNADEYIRNSSNYKNYDDITLSDSSWDGDSTHEEIKTAILNKEFNYAKTKYISINTIYDMAKVSMQQSYFFNILYDNILNEENITIKVPAIGSGSYKISDIFVLLTALGYYYYGIDDLIIDSGEQVLAINGFNFRSSMAILAESLYAFDPETNSIPSFGELMNLYVNNIDVRTTLIEGMYNADNYVEYTVYKNLYDALMTITLTFDFYKDPDTNDYTRNIDGDATFTAYLMRRNTDIYNSLVAADTYEDSSAKLQYIANLIDNIIYSLEEYMNVDTYSGLFKNLPAVSTEAAKTYIATIINFFKSFKVDFLGMDTIYHFSDKYEGAIKIIEDAQFRRWFDKYDSANIIDWFFSSRISLTKTDNTNITDNAWYNSVYYIDNAWYNSVYYIDFEENGGTEVAPLYTDIIEASPATTKIRELDSFEYTLLGWYLDNDTFKNKVLFPYTLTTGGILYAFWLDFEYTLHDTYAEITRFIGDIKSTIPDTIESLPVTSIAAAAIDGSRATNLQSIIVSDNVTTIGNNSFAGCPKLATVIMSKNVAIISDGAFSNCSLLTKITLPKNAITIQSGAFANCGSLASITIPDKVTTINGAAFVNCTSLALANFLGNAPSTWGNGIFTNCSGSFKIYYLYDKTGWSTPTFNGYAAYPAYLIIFETNGGSIIEDLVCQSIDMSPVSSYNAYALEGWYSEAALTNKLSFPYTPTDHATLYAHWTYWKYINGLSSQIHTTQGSNLTNIPDQNVSYTNGYANDYFPQSPKVLLQPSTTYTVALDYVINLATYDVSIGIGYGDTHYRADIVSASIYPTQTSGRAVVRFTTPATFSYNPAYLQLRLARSTIAQTVNVDVSNIIVVLGSYIELPYEAFVPNSPTPNYPSAITSSIPAGYYKIADPDGGWWTLILEEDLRGIGSYLDKIELDVLDGTGRIRRIISKKIFNGAENWSVGGTYTNTIRFDSSLLTGGANGDPAFINRFCSHFIVSRNNIDEIEHHRGSLNPGLGAYTVFWINKSRLSSQDVAGFNAYLAAQYAASTPVTVYYQLATETVTDLTLIHTDASDYTELFLTEL